MHLRRLIVPAALLCAASLQAQVTLPSLFSDHAVLQREAPIHIWGQATGGEQVEVRFHNQKAAAVADTVGYWELWLKPEPAGGPYKLAAQGAGEPQAVERTDILVGDVWVASGQSNMEFPLKGFNGAPLQNGADEIAHATQPNIRQILQPRRTSAAVVMDTDASWTLCTPDTASNFSAVAYFFAREISAKEHVPIGIIDSTWGGTPAHAWMSSDAIAYFDLTSVLTDAALIARDQGFADKLKAQYAVEDAAAKAAGKAATQHPRIPNDHAGSWAPATLYNAMIAPYTRFTIKGAIWYQGEADAAVLRAPNYSRVFGSMIQDWRTQWNQGPFPFLFVQISSFGSNDATWGTTRDQQRLVAETVPHTGMAVTLDIGLHGNIHPPDKQTVGHRLALLARSQVYGESIASESPTPIYATSESGQAHVWLQHAEGLHAVSGTLGDFEIAGDDGKFVPATASIDGTTIVVQAATVPNPRIVRYGWKGTVTSYVANGADLPIGTFSIAIR
ncbi:MAG TPA: sialate O-acetylesterase [Acidobacteriaceae bacterium]|jgi:sialate O-acetylesterase